LLGKGRIEDTGLVAGSKSVLDALALLSLLLGFAFLDLLLADLDTVVLLVPLSERSSVNLNDAVLHQSVGSDQLVVGGIVQYSQDTGLGGSSLSGPVEVTSLETKSAVFDVSTTATDRVDTLGSKLGQGGRATHLKLSLLADSDTLSTGSSALMDGVTRSLDSSTTYKSWRHIFSVGAEEAQHQ